MSISEGKALDTALPSDAVEIIGLDQVPVPGDAVAAVKDDRDAKTVIAHRLEERRKKAQQGTQKVTLETLLAARKEGEIQELKVIIKADVQGSVEAVKEVVGKLSDEQVRALVINDGVGAITESDVMLASASNAVILGFNVRPETKALRLAEQEKVDIKLYRIIYELVDELKLAMQGLLAPKSKEVYHGRAEVRQTFAVSKVGLIAGSFVVDGKLSRNSKVRLLRDNVVIADVSISSLKRFKEDVREVSKGFECGVGLEGYSDIKPGDVLEAYAIESI
jgi:translation initiation factor IF-2